MFSGCAAKKAASALSDSKVEVTVSKATSGPSRILNPCASSLVRAPLPFLGGEGGRPGDDGYDLADVQRDDMPGQFFRRNAPAHQGLRGDRHQPVEFAAMRRRPIPSRYRQEAAAA